MWHTLDFISSLIGSETCLPIYKTKILLVVINFEVEDDLYSLILLWLNSPIFIGLFDVMNEMTQPTTKQRPNQVQNEDPTISVARGGQGGGRAGGIMFSGCPYRPSVRPPCGNLRIWPGNPISSPQWCPA